MDVNLAHLETVMDQLGIERAPASSAKNDIGGTVLYAVTAGLWGADKKGWNVVMHCAPDRHTVLAVLKKPEWRKRLLVLTATDRDTEEAECPVRINITGIKEEGAGEIEEGTVSVMMSTSYYPDVRCIKLDADRNTVWSYDTMSNGPRRKFVGRAFDDLMTKRPALGKYVAAHALPLMRDILAAA